MLQNVIKKIVVSVETELYKRSDFISVDFLIVALFRL